MALGATIFSRLNGFSEIKNAVKGNIFPEFRDKAVPAIVYEINIDEVNHTYSAQSDFSCDLTLSVIAQRYATAVELADLVIKKIDCTAWEDSEVCVLGSFWKSQDEDYIQRSDKEDRLAVINCRFELSVRNKS